jgi:hypothetical protein
MLVSAIVTLLILALLIWLWQSQLKAKEVALAVSKAFCEQHHWQLLDDTVALKKTRLYRQAGTWHIQRRYQFDYCQQGDIRQQASLTLNGYQVQFAPTPASASQQSAQVLSFTKYQAKNDINKKIH